MGTTFFKFNRFVFVVAALIIALAIACGSDNEPVVVPTATAAPVQTATPAPTATPVPTVAATSTAVPIVAAMEATSLADLETRAFPDAIKDDAEKLSGDEVEAVWTEYLSGARWGSAATTDTATYFCHDGTGQILNDPGNVYASGPEGRFQWHVESRPGSRWNDVSFVFLNEDPAFHNVFSPDGNYSWSLRVEVDQVSIAGSFLIDDVRLTQRCT